MICLVTHVSSTLPTAPTWSICPCLLQLPYLLQLPVQCALYVVQATIEHRKLAVDLAEVIIKWEFQRVRERQGQDVSGDPWKCMRLKNMHKTVCMFVTVIISLGRGQRLAEAYWHLQVAVSTALYANWTWTSVHAMSPPPPPPPPPHSPLCPLLSAGRGNGHRQQFRAAGFNKQW